MYIQFFKKCSYNDINLKIKEMEYSYIFTYF